MNISKFFFEIIKLQITHSKQELRQKDLQVKIEAKERRIVTTTKQKQRDQIHELLLKHQRTQTLQLQIQLIIIQAQTKDATMFVKRRRRRAKTLFEIDEIIDDELI